MGDGSVVCCRASLVLVAGIFFVSAQWALSNLDGWERNGAALRTDQQVLETSSETSTLPRSCSCASSRCLTCSSRDASATRMHQLSRLSANPLYLLPPRSRIPRASASTVHSAAKRRKVREWHQLALPHFDVTQRDRQTCAHDPGWRPTAAAGWAWVGRNGTSEA